MLCWMSDWPARAPAILDALPSSGRNFEARVLNRTLKHKPAGGLPNSIIQRLAPRSATCRPHACSVGASTASSRNSREQHMVSNSPGRRHRALPGSAGARCGVQWSRPRGPDVAAVPWARREVSASTEAQRETWLDVDTESGLSDFMAYLEPD